MASVTAEVSDEVLVKSYRKGDTKALAELVDRYKIRLFTFILNMAGGPDEANDVFQEVWLRAIERIDIYRDKNFLAWLTRIAHNLMIDRWRARKETISLDATEEEGGFDLSNRLTGPEPTPDRLAETNDTVRNITEALDALPVEQREVFLMRAREDMSFKEIAKIQGVSMGTVLARMQYSLPKLRRLLEVEHGPVKRGCT